MEKKTKFKRTEIGMIPEDWAIKLLSQVTHIIGGGTPKTSNPDYWDGDIPWISVTDFVGDNRWIHKTAKTITNKGLDESSTKLLHKGQLIISARGTVGEVGQVTKDMAFNQSCYGLDGKDGVLNDFLYYLLRYKVRDLQSKTHGSVFSTITRTTFDQILVQIPDRPEQSAIAEILSSLDSKIELNRQTNITLEAMAQTLFKRWFVDFEFPNEKGKPYKSNGGVMVDSELGKIPKGWRISKLNEVAGFTRGFSYKGSEKSGSGGNHLFITLNSIKEGGGFKREFCYITSDRLKDRHMVEEGDIVITNTEQTKTGTLLGFPALVEFPTAYANKQSVFSHHITKVTPFHKQMKYYLHSYLLTNQSVALKYHTGSVIWALDVNGWTKNEKILIPENSVLEKYSRIAGLLFRKRLTNCNESENLAAIRDLLLPRLISGQIRIPIKEVAHATK